MKTGNRDLDRLVSALLRHYEFVFAQYQRECSAAGVIATTSELAQRLIRNRSTFSRTFSKVTGKHLLAVMRLRQLKDAERLIRTTNLPIAEVARRCAFGPVQSTFARAFHAVYGMSPREYRRRSKK